MIRHALRPAAGEPEGALVLIHGRGADEHDLLPVADAIDPERRLVVAAPRGPLSMPPGGAHWYAVRRIGYPDPETFLAVLPHVAAWLDGLEAITGVPLARTVVGGFSQGCVMTHALAFGPGRPTPAGIIGLSGFMPTVEGYPLDLAVAAGLPAFIAHGTHDPVIGVEWGRDARDRLTAAGADLTYREHPVAHTIAPQIVPELKQWLAAAIAAAPR